VVLPTKAEQHLKKSAELRNEAARAQTRAAQEARTAARELAATGMTLRDIGAALGISHQRAQQLIKAPLETTASRTSPGRARRTVIRERPDQASNDNWP